jgi:hypothetical protein
MSPPAERIHRAFAARLPVRFRETALIGVSFLHPAELEQLRPQDCGEGSPVAPEQENEKSRDDEREWKPFGGEEDMEEDDVNNDRSEDGEAERHETA